MTAGVSGAQGGDAVLRLRGLSKTFGSTRALRDVDLDVARGEVHALVGGNGSGKSTLIKILAGVETADPGARLQLEGTDHGLSSWGPARSRAAGLRFVHQDAGIFADLSVAENLAAGRGYPTGAMGRIRWRELDRRAREVLERFEIDAEPRTSAASLGPAMRMMVAIARALQDVEAGGSGVLVLDEPTAALPAHEVEVLISAIRRYAAAGQTIVYVSHRLDEVLDLGDRVTALRDGEHVATVPVEGLTEERLIELVVGRSLDRVYPARAPRPDADVAALEVLGLSTGPVRDVSFAVWPGEVLGIAGLLGSGRTELLQGVFGARPLISGTVSVGGREVRLRDPRDAMAAGIAYVPEDRAGMAAFADLSIRENLSAGQVSSYWRGLRMDARRERDDARTSIERFLIKTPSSSSPLSALSGGNQQKVVLARWLRREPRVLLLDEPTQAVDVGARSEIYALVGDAVATGAGAVVVSSDFEELAHMCDRVLVLADGRFAGEAAGDELTAARLTELSYGAPEGAVS